MLLAILFPESFHLGDMKETIFFALIFGFLKTQDLSQNVQIHFYYKDIKQVLTVSLFGKILSYTCL